MEMDNCPMARTMVKDDALGESVTGQDFIVELEDEGMTHSATVVGATEAPTAVDVGGTPAPSSMDVTPLPRL